VEGIPRLYLETSLGEQDRRLRDSLYDGLIGRHYKRLMPFLLLPVRPLKVSWRGWLAYALLLCLFAAAIADVVHLLVVRSFWPGDMVVLAAALLAGWFLVRHRYLFNLLLLALPARLAIARSSFEPAETFLEIHRRILADLRPQPAPLEILDVATGTCNSLFRHGWMSLEARYTAVDLSETMLRQGARFMRSEGIHVDFAVADAARLPFVPGFFDVVLSYGAVNGMTDPACALAEMARVTKPGGLILFLDEQLHAEASRVERRYFERVLSSHDVIHHCPVEHFPKNVEGVEVHQVYAFYYLCLARKTKAQSYACGS
jgi:SAM-dependent methyltransferase